MTTTLLLMGLAFWLGLAVIVALVIGRVVRRADRERDFEMWRDELNRHDDEPDD